MISYVRFTYSPRQLNSVHFEPRLRHYDYLRQLSVIKSHNLKKHYGVALLYRSTRKLSLTHDDR
eukprot:UN14914